MTPRAAQSSLSKFVRRIRTGVPHEEPLLGAGPLRGEPLGADRLAERALDLAREQVVAPPQKGRLRAPLLGRLYETRRVLDDARERLSAYAADDGDVGPAGDWLLDNFHVVEEHIREVHESLPRGYYRELPVLANGQLAGYPRVYELAITLISHTEGRVDLDSLDLFVAAFQRLAPLTIGELWAIPAMLRLGCLESVRRMTLRTVERIDELRDADSWAARIEEAAEDGARAMRRVLETLVVSTQQRTPTMVARLFQQLRPIRGAHAALLHMKKWLGADALSAEDAIAQSTRRLALTQLMMANSIRSLLAITHTDWRTFVEGQSGMEAVLREDPSGFYPKMTFATRDHFRHVVERIARRVGADETVIAQRAVDFASAALLVADDARRRHVGYYLIDDGLPLLEVASGYRAGTREGVNRWILRHASLCFGGGIAVTTVAVLALIVALAGPAAANALVLVLAFAALPAVDVAIAIVNLLITAIVPPRLLPKLDFDAPDGIPADHRTAAVVPVLLGSVASVGEALEHLEVQYLANRDPHLHFALLSDYTDSPTETRDGDADILAAAEAGIQELNDQYAPDTQDAFFLFHRGREWNAQQGTWMGWERKRGKLGQFNRLVRGGVNTFERVVGRAAALTTCRYVITLDSDTVLPPGAARVLVGTLAHPLNRAVYDANAGRVTRGYGILQPRVSVSLPSANGSRFSAINSGHPGVDPYTTAVSDVYQDLYGEGSFTGKGIYDIEAFERATHGRFPENTLLSHDLIEGSYARAGLVTDVVLYDDYPAHYLSYVQRKRRWTRGDWQLLPWLMPLIRSGGKLERSHLSMLSRWKILDNLRRSTVEIAQLALLFAGWTLLPGSALRWTFIALGAMAAPWAGSVLLGLLRPPFDATWRSHYSAAGRDALVAVQQFMLAVVFLPHQAWVAVTAIGRTLWRLSVSRRHLLEWQTAKRTERTMSGATASVVKTMWPAIVIGLLAMRWSPIGVLWTVSPWVAVMLSQRISTSVDRLSADARVVALRYARLHWEYFAHFVSEQTHWLVPDNVQEDPAQVIAMRTSPTNLGLQLLATVSAHDLGFIDADDMATRLERALETMTQLRRSHGHFYNWYDLHDLRVLEPAYISTADSGNLAGHLMALRQACLSLAEGDLATPLPERLTEIADRAHALLMAMDFRILYDEKRKLFAIGIHDGAQGIDASFYDLLASEARLASFVAIAKHDVPVEHWFHLGRTLTRTPGGTALVSWSGSMFEYLMPMLVMRTFPQTILAQTYESAVQRHIAFGVDRNVPWGVSESAYNLRDRHLTYQYRAFGVPDLALKRGLGRDLVIAPYASLLAAMTHPSDAFENLARLEGKGALGDYGFHDAVDYTRPDPGSRFAVVHNYMAHHVGMGLVALTNVLRDDVWARRFHTDLLVKAAELLLHERVPRRLVVQDAKDTRPEKSHPDPAVEQPVVREVEDVNRATPRVALLGRLPYTIMVSHAGSGYSRYEDLAVTRWRADGTTDDSGQFCYIKDVSRNRLWSAAHQPVCAPGDRYRAMLATDRVTFERTDGDIETRMEIAVAPEDAAEIRRVTVRNTGDATRELEITSYGEVVLAPPASDSAHPAFANLFVETEFHDWCAAVTATRRPRASSDPRLWGVHVASTDEALVGEVTCETDRARFIGRGRSVRDPVAEELDGPLSGTSGAVLDPVFALRARVRLAPGQSASVAFTTLVTHTREQAFLLADRYHDPRTVQRALDLAWSSTQMELRELAVTPTDAAVFQDLAGHLFFPVAVLRASQDELRRNRGSQHVLWSQGISGDWPIVLATIDSEDGLLTLRQLFTAHHYWRRRGMMVDLVILNAHPAGYIDELKTSMLDAMYASNEPDELDKPGGVFIRRVDQLDATTLLMLRATARLHVVCDGSTLASLIASVAPPTVARVNLRTPTSVGHDDAPAQTDEASALAFDNGYGGVAPDGSYRIRVRGDVVPPAPWVNVIANEHGGFLVSERGAGCTWAGNSYFFRLTPWHNDPVIDPVGEAIYLRDEESGVLWSPTPAPIHSDHAYTVAHQQGATVFEHSRGGITTHLTMSLVRDAAVKLQVLRITNDSETPRRITFTSYAEWTLGPLREHTQHQVHTAFDVAQSAVMATNPFDQQFAGMVAFAASSEKVSAWTCDRRDFLGRNGTTAAPNALMRKDTVPLSGAFGVTRDPCAVLQSVIELAPGETREVVVVLGAAASEREARELLTTHRQVPNALAAIAGTVEDWTRRLSVVSVRTPDPAFDAMLNNWTLYQALGCRMWARTATYQSSGAYGFRDQLQDVLAFVYAEPAIARAHILRAAARQFVEGDVQHWWHPDSGRGVRTRFSDDLAWLPFVVARYVHVTGDASILEEDVSFLEMRALEPHEHEIYDLPRVSGMKASIYEHCLRALRRACTIGSHGLPLMGSGDWNDGMNRVGADGKGESVWLAWFLSRTLRDFAVIAEAREAHVAEELRATAGRYGVAVEEHGWDGAWYRRAYFDDGTPLGTSTDEECRIDSIAQSWSVISGSADPVRTAQAMQSLQAHLVDDAEKLILLLKPPFDKGARDPGYIKGYLPGVRENGAQYTHAALWAVQATAMLGDGDRAFEMYQMLNPLMHASTAESVERYKVEPYVIAADVYTAAGQHGRGGWTWYTGSASWMYRVGLESLLGFNKCGDVLTIEPRVPESWPAFSIEYRYGTSVYAIEVREPAAVGRRGASVSVDGMETCDGRIRLVDDGRRYTVVVRVRREA